MRHSLFTITTTISLLLCIAAAVLWWRSWRHAPLGEDRFSWVSGNIERLTLRSTQGRLVLYGPPPGNPFAVAQFGTRTSDDIGRLEKVGTPLTQRSWELARPPVRPVIDASLDQILAKLDNDQISWRAFIPRDGRFERGAGRGSPYPVSLDCLGLRSGVPAQSLGPRRFCVVTDQQQTFLDPSPFKAADITAGLLLALEDPSRFIAAHVLLNRPPMHRIPLALEADGTATTSLDGLQLRILSRDGRSLVATDWYGTTPRIEIAPEQIPLIRNEWHRRLDVERMSAPYWLLTLATALLPLLWVSGSVQRVMSCRRRRRLGLCLTCGYDLRGSAGRCPECGTVPTAAK
jgi:hypothetical protein